MTLKADPCKVITGTSRATMMFVNQLSDTDKDGKSQDPQCATGILIPKKDKKTIAAIEKAISAACKKKGIKNPGKSTRKFWYPLQDCDEAMDSGDFEPEDPSIYEGNMYLKAKKFSLPGLVDASNTKIEDTEDRQTMCVSGYWFRFSITFKGFSNEMDGCWVQLNNLMFVKEDDRLDGGASAESDFEDFADDDEDDDDIDFDSKKSKKKSKRDRSKRRNR